MPKHNICPVCGKAHFGLCHKCPHAGEEMEKTWKRRRWEDTPCATCQLSEEGRAAGHGRGLSLEHVPPRELLGNAGTGGEGASAEQIEAADPREAFRRLLAFFRAWREASEEEARWMRDVLAFEMTNEQMAKRYGITVKTASARRARVMGMLGREWNAETKTWAWAEAAE